MHIYVLLVRYLFRHNPNVKGLVGWQLRLVDLNQGYANYFRISNVPVHVPKLCNENILCLFYGS